MTISERDPVFWRNKRVLVTGAGGFVGRNLVPLLEQTGCTLILPGRRDYDLLEQAPSAQAVSGRQARLRLSPRRPHRRHPGEQGTPRRFLLPELAPRHLDGPRGDRAGVEKYVTLMGGCSYPGQAPVRFPSQRSGPAIRNPKAPLLSRQGDRRRTRRILPQAVRLQRRHARPRQPLWTLR